VSITFNPLTLATERLELEVRVSEFNRRPATCVVTGSVLPGLAKDRRLLEAMLRTTHISSNGAGGGGGGDGGGDGDDAPLRLLASTARAIAEGDDSSLAMTMSQLDGTEMMKVRLFV
jgi:hypothetical protein